MDPSKSVKKIFSLAKIKIRLASEADTVEVRPKPLPIVKFFSDAEVNTVDEAKSYLNCLREKLSPDNFSEIVLELLDIIEGVKYKFDAVPEISDDDFRKLEGSPATIHIYTDSFPDSVGVEAGSNSTELGAVPSSVIYFLRYSFTSNYFSDGKSLKNIQTNTDSKSLIVNGVVSSVTKLLADDL